MAKKIPFVMSDDSINVYGFRVLTAGIDFSDFQNNPVGYWNHRADDEYKNQELLPLFRWEALRKQDNKLIGDCIPDEADELAMTIAGKMERGFINACSIWFDVVETSEDPAFMLPGQTRPTVTKCKLIECSPVGIPGNSRALKLRNQAGQVITLSGETAGEELDQILPTISFQNQNQTNMSLLIRLAATLGLDAKATEDQVAEAVTKLKNDHSESAGKVQELQTKLQGIEANSVKELLDGAVEDGKITEADRENYQKLAALNFDATKKALDAIKPAPSLTQMLRGGKAAQPEKGSVAGDEKDCEFDRLSKTNPKELARISQEEPERYAEMKEERRTLSRSKR